MDKTYAERVGEYIRLGNMSDLQGMSELAFEITCTKQEAYEARKKTEYNQEIARITYFKTWRGKQRKDWKDYSDVQADKLGKEQAMKEFDYSLFECKYRELAGLLDRLLERKIEVQSINKQSKELLANSTKNG